MTLQELLYICDVALAGTPAIGVRLVSPDVGQPIRGFRAELLCVNSAGQSVYRYSPAQVRRIRRAVLAALAEEVEVRHPAVGTILRCHDGTELEVMKVRATLHGTWLLIRDGRWSQDHGGARACNASWWPLASWERAVNEEAQLAAEQAEP